MKKFVQLSLMEELLLHKISHKDFIDKIMELDQSTPDRTDAAINLSVLKNKKIKKIFKKSYLKKEYLNLLSLTYFHLGQANADKDNKKALHYFKSSLKASNRLGFNRHTQWKKYIKGTIAYFNYDKNKLKKILLSLDEGRNKNIIKHFLERLEKGNNIEYKKDYSILD
jgi:hypothetical protein